MQCVDLRSGVRCLVESRSGVIVIEKGWLPSASPRDVVQAVAPSMTEDAESVQFTWHPERQQLQLFVSWTPALQAENPVIIPLSAWDAWANAALDMPYTAILESTPQPAPQPALQALANDRITTHEIASPTALVDHSEIDPGSPEPLNNQPHNNQPQNIVPQNTAPQNTDSQITERYILRMVPSPQRPTKLADRYGRAPH